VSTTTSTTTKAAGEQLLDVRVARAAPWKRWYLQNERLVLGLVGFVVVLAIWELAVNMGWLRAVFISSPSRIWRAAILEVQTGRIWGDIAASMLVYVLGFTAAAVVGIAIGLVAGWFKHANYIVDPWLSALYATPDIALAPLIILVLGIGVPSKVFVVFLTAVFVVAVNTLVGVKSTDARMLDVARSFSASRGRVFRTVVLPSTIPFIMTGLRLASGRALVGVVLAELIAANQGIGFLISISGTTLNTARMMVGVLLLGIFGVLIGEVMRRIEMRFDMWRPRVN
jgi:ABC-type nitrate/sulfonate/bicarbonate transport system permease component